MYADTNRSVENRRITGRSTSRREGYASHGVAGKKLDGVIKGLRLPYENQQAVGRTAPSSRGPHSRFHVHAAVWVPEDDRAFATQLARYCARNPVALERLTYDRAAKAVTYRSDKSEGPTAGTETVEPWPGAWTHIPDKGHVTTRYYGWYANQPRGTRAKAAPAAARPHEACHTSTPQE